MKLHTGLVSLVTADAIQRTKLIKAAEGIGESQMPSRMRGASEFNMSPWRAGWHRDTKGFVTKVGIHDYCIAFAHPLQKLPPLIPWKEVLRPVQFESLARSPC